MLADAGRMFTYSEVVGILAGTFKAVGDWKPQTLKWLQGRLKRYQVDGLAPASPGKGYSVRYSIGDIYHWGFAIQLAELGVDSRISVKKLKGASFLARFGEQLVEAARLGAELYLVLFPNLYQDVLPSTADLDAWRSLLSTELQHQLFDAVGTLAPFALINLSRLVDRIDEVAESIEDASKHR